LGALLLDTGISIRILHEYQMPTTQLATKCPRCSGRGTYESATDPYRSCATCHGDGVVDACACGRAIPVGFGECELCFESRLDVELYAASDEAAHRATHAWGSQ
jgi:RecJ-like exonuclease